MIRLGPCRRGHKEDARLAGRQPRNGKAFTWKSTCHFQHTGAWGGKIRRWRRKDIRDNEGGGGAGALTKFLSHAGFIITIKISTPAHIKENAFYSVLFILSTKPEPTICLYISQCCHNSLKINCFNSQKGLIFHFKQLVSFLSKVTGGNSAFV